MSQFWGGMLRMCERIDGQTKIPMTGGWQIWATRDARISGRPLALGGFCTALRKMPRYSRCISASRAVATFGLPTPLETLERAFGLQPRG